jgi:hypothetical protein
VALNGNSSGIPGNNQNNEIAAAPVEAGSERRPLIRQMKKLKNKEVEDHWSGGPIELDLSRAKMFKLRN